MKPPISGAVTMDAPDTRIFEDPIDWLTREQIDKIIEGMSAGDLVKALGQYPDGSVQMPIAAFDLAAERMGLSNGSPASDHIRMSEFKYLGESIGEAVNVESPLSERQGG